MKEKDVHSELYDYYAHSDGYLSHLKRKTAVCFQDYVQLIRSFIKESDSNVLDIGIGTGESTRLIQSSFRHTYGTDISALFLKSSNNSHHCFFVADAYNLPIRSEFFDVVCSFEFIEHVNDVPKLLDEMIRIMIKNGTLVIMSPSLLSPIRPVKDILLYLIGKQTVTPWSLTFSHTIRWLFVCLFENIKKVVLSDPIFVYRNPELSERADNGGDYDSVYLSHPLDIVKYLRLKGMNIKLKCIGRSKSGKFIASYFPYFAMSMAIIAKK
jgi:SAM-dependent methyltransferase